MAETGLRQLLEAGVHFGHQTSRWNPKMKRYIFAERNGIHIIDLKKSLRMLQEAQEALRDLTLNGERILCVCTKPQLRGLVEEAAKRCGAYYVTERWLGGMLTNFQTIKKQIRRMKELERGIEEGAFEFYTKKEQLLLDRERQKLEKYLGGVKQMTQLPAAIYVVDATRENIAVREANKLDIPVIAIADTNADPDMIDYPVPGNDDAIRSVALITRAIADTVEGAQRELPPEEQRRRQEGEAVTYTAEKGLSEAAEQQPKQPKQPQKRPKRRRRPRPEVIASVRGGEEASEEE